MTQPEPKDQEESNLYFFLSKDKNDYWYVVDANYRSYFYDWLMNCEKNEAEYEDIPCFALLVGKDPSAVEFLEYRVNYAELTKPTN